MANGFGVVGSVLTEKPPADSPWTTGPSAPITPAPAPLTTAAEARERSWYEGLLGGREYEVVYDDAEGYPLLAFAEGQWYDVTSFTPRPVSVRYALRRDPAWSGAVVQTVCLWMRGHPHHERSFELATELALAVGELARHAGHGAV
ncbi:MAG: hypothetical protein ACRDVN_09085 [Jiangellaceae bacterium]